MMEVATQKSHDEILECIPGKFRNLFGISQVIGSISIPLLILFTVFKLGELYPLLYFFFAIPAFLSFFIATFMIIFWWDKSNIKYFTFPIWSLTLVSSFIDLLVAKNHMYSISSITISFIVLLILCIRTDIFNSEVPSKIKYVAIPLQFFTAIVLIIYTFLTFNNQ